MAFGETVKHAGPSLDLSDTENGDLSKVEGTIDKLINQGMR